MSNWLKTKYLAEIAGLAIFVVLLGWYGTHRQIEAAPKAVAETPPKAVEKPVAVTHLATPAFVKGIYLNSGVAASQKVRKSLIELVKRTELNSMVIDIKDDFGRIAIPVKDPTLGTHLSKSIMITDLDALIAELHAAHIYVIARLFVFQDRALVEARPDLAVQSTRGGVWRDKKGVAWIDAAAEDAWAYNAAIARDAYAHGFDEVQLDYIRFPSDGNMALVKYTHFDAKKESRSDVMTRFFTYMDTELRAKGIPISADLFGFAYWERDYDMSIGQRIRDAAPHFTALSPMTYPSHYPAGTLGFANPALHPYEIIAETLKRGNKIMTEFPNVKFATRPWIQDFDIGADYTPTLIQAEMKAVVDGGGTGWLLWNARNVYTEGALLKE